MINLVKEKNMKGKEEFIEIKYDPQGNIISRKKVVSVIILSHKIIFMNLKIMIMMIIIMKTTIIIIILIMKLIMK